MKRFLYSILIICSLLQTAELSAHKRAKARAEVLSNSRNYYKEVMMDGGIGLTSRFSLPATRLLDIQMEFFASASKKNLTQRDTLLQTNIFIGSKADTNGWLLYPDGAPRYRVLYVNGGRANNHALSLGTEGRARIQEFVENGGSFVGTCAGAYIATKGGVSRYEKIRHSDKYWGLWPGYAKSTRLTKSSTTLLLERKSPLLRYFDFGGDKEVAEVRHNGGCYAYHGKLGDIAEGTETLARYRFDNTERVKIDGEMAVWAYKKSEQSGRVILCGSHPEGAGTGERLDFMAAMLLYAMDGNPTPQPKGTLKDGEVREMNRRTEDNDPAFTRIGDRQYHHFELNVPRKCKRIIVKIDGYKGEKRYDLTLCAKRGELAFHDNTTLKSVSRGFKKSLTIEQPKAGKWFVSVFCENTVVPFIGKYGTFYRGRTAVLNGVPYKISVEYE